MKQVEQETGETPLALLNRPVPDEWTNKYWQMYQQTSGSRQYTFGGPAEIPYPVKLKWLDENNVLDPDDRDDFLFITSKIDNAYLEHSAKKSENK